MSGSKVLPLRESPTNPKSVDVYLEIGPKRTFAGALDWPAWCRYGRNEEEALAALFEYVPRYARVLSGTRLGFTAPEKIDRLCVVERLEGNATTDFGAINVPPSVDADSSFDDDEHKRFEKILGAGWRCILHSPSHLDRAGRRRPRSFRDRRPADRRSGRSGFRGSGVRFSVHRLRGSQRLDGRSLGEVWTSDSGRRRAEGGGRTAEGGERHVSRMQCYYPHMPR